MFQVFDLGNGREAVRCTTSGRTCHIVRRDNATWTVEEDERHAVFLTYGSALDCARELAGDPGLPPLDQV